MKNLFLLLALVFTIGFISCTENELDDNLEKPTTHATEKDKTDPRGSQDPDDN